MKRIAIIGIGLLGSAVALRLLEGGFTVVGHDSRREQLKPLAPRGLVAANSVKNAAAGADAIFTILPTPDSVEATILGPGGLLEAMPGSATLLQMSTISPALTRRLADAATAAGRGFLDTPMSGTSAMVERGDCTIFVGGDAAALEGGPPLLAAIARRAGHVGTARRAARAELL